MGKNIIVIGGGPAGYVAAIRAAQSGAGVSLIEKSTLGGTCLNAGCIPTKALLRIGEFYHMAKTEAVPGVKSSADLNWSSAVAHKNAVVKRLSDGISLLLQRNNVQVISGNAVVLPELQVRVGEETLTADAIIIATGSINAEMTFAGSGLDGVIDSAAALDLEQPPKSIAIIGGGVVGIEFATLFVYLGADVTLVEMMPEILPSMDMEIAGLLRGKLTADGVKILLNSRLDSVERAGESLIAHIKNDGRKDSIRAEKVLVAAGRRPNTSGLGLEALGLDLDCGAIVVDDNYQTNISGIYAVGDCNALIMLAHAAMEQGSSAVEHILGSKKSGDLTILPSCVYSSPEIASVGLTEQQLQEEGIPYDAGRFILAGNGKALIEGGEGLIKILAGKDFGEVLGVHMIGPNVTEIVAEAALCMKMEGTAEDIFRTIHPHPTVSESLREAAMAVRGSAIHGV